MDGSRYVVRHAYATTGLVAYNVELGTAGYCAVRTVALCKALTGTHGSRLNPARPHRLAVRLERDRQKVGVRPVCKHALLHPPSVYQHAAEDTSARRCTARFAPCAGCSMPHGPACCTIQCSTSMPPPGCKCKAVHHNVASTQCARPSALLRRMRYMTGGIGLPRAWAMYTVRRPLCGVRREYSCPARPSQAAERRRRYGS